MTDTPWYEIRIAGPLHPRWHAWFDGLTITSGAEETLLRGPLPDQAALHGVLARIRDLNLPLLSVNVRPAPTGSENAAV